MPEVKISLLEEVDFAMYDNCDNLKDSGFWGFVPDKNVVGRASVIWWNFDKLGRIGTSIN